MALLERTGGRQLANPLFGVESYCSFKKSCYAADLERAISCRDMLPSALQSRTGTGKSLINSKLVSMTMMGITFAPHLAAGNFVTRQAALSDQSLSKSIDCFDFTLVSPDLVRRTSVRIWGDRPVNIGLLEKSSGLGGLWPLSGSSPPKIQKLCHGFLDFILRNRFSSSS